MRFFLVVVLIVVMLFNYQVLSLDTGVTSFDGGEKLGSLEGLIDVAVNVGNVVFYENKLQFLSSIKEDVNITDVYDLKTLLAVDNFAVIRTEDGEAYFLPMSDRDIKILDGASLFNKNLEPKRITPVSIYIYLVAIALLIFFPRAKKRKKKRR